MILNLGHPRIGTSILRLCAVLSASLGYSDLPIPMKGLAADLGDNLCPWNILPVQRDLVYLGLWGHTRESKLTM